MTTQVPVPGTVAPGDAGGGAPAATSAPAIAPAAQAPASSPPANADPAVAAGASPSGAVPAPVERDWREERIAKLTAKLKEANAKLEEAGRPAPQATQPTSVAQPGLQPGSPEFQRAVDLAAQQKKEIDDWNAMCNTIAQDGRTRFGQAEFNKAVSDLNSLIDKTDPNSMLAFNAMINAANAAGDGAFLLMELGRDLNQAAKVLGMNPVHMTAEFTRRVIAAKSAAPGGEPTLPKPITPVGGRGPAHTEIAASDPLRASSLTTTDWMARREAEVEARRRQKMGLPAA